MKNLIRKTILSCLILSTLTITVVAQPTFQIAKNAQTISKAQPEMLRTVSKGMIMEVIPETLNEIKRTQPVTMRLDIPAKDKNFELDLVKADIFTDDFKVISSSGRKRNIDLGVHYRGTIKGDNNSMVALSFQNGEMSGFFANDEGNYVIGKVNNAKSRNNEHIVYLEEDLTQQNNPGCSTDDSSIPHPNNIVEITGNTKRSRPPAHGITLYVEVDYDIYQNKGAGTEAFVTSIFNQSLTLFAREQVVMKLSVIKVWDTPSPYTGNDSHEMLAQFQNQHDNGISPTHNVDLRHLVSYRASGSGVAATIGNLCENLRGRMCFSGINSNNTPNQLNYTWNVYLVTHEMGHLLGSPHTHSCSWNGNDTAIDGCSGSTHGDCGVPGNPQGGGTMMSYCHWTGVGINFNLGFGQQPGDVIRRTAEQVLNTIGQVNNQHLGPLTLFGEGVAFSETYGWIYIDKSNNLCDPSRGILFKAYGPLCGYPHDTWFVATNSGPTLLAITDVITVITCPLDGQARVAQKSGKHRIIQANEIPDPLSDDMLKDAPDLEKLLPQIQKMTSGRK